MSAMQPFRQVSGIAAPLFLAEINTDALMPSAWNVAHPDRPGEGLLRLSRYRDGIEDPDFVLNRAPFREARFLIAGPNFGCGSSRETAVWALTGFGIRAVIAPDFGEIFRENAYQNGLLPVVLPHDIVAAMAEVLETAVPPKITVDLEACTVTGPDGAVHGFDLPQDRREMLLRGQDETDALLGHANEIAVWQGRDRTANPWKYPAPA